ncbi:hypothetical protein GCM10020220_070190 [Nonomuraea rubra]|uniref:thioesterase domain-containing protein n=1 Tax=Nonomuraea rubra TaxID=46180 RepID=UPI0031E5F33B
MTALACLGENPAAALRLICFPHSGGQPGMFRRWVAGLAPDVEVWGATLPGRATGVERAVRPAVEPARRRDHRRRARPGAGARGAVRAQPGRAAGPSRWGAR